MIPVRPAPADGPPPTDFAWLDESLSGESSDEDDEEFEVTDWNGIHGSHELEQLPVGELLQLLGDEQRCLELVDALSGSVEDFEMNSGAVEGSWTEDLVNGTDDRTGALDELAGTIDCNRVLYGLDLGVASLSFALAAVDGAVPRASCRSHDGTPSWSTYPTVQFESTFTAFERIRDLSRTVDSVGFHWDEERGLVCLVARSVVPLLGLSSVLINQIVA